MTIAKSNRCNEYMKEIEHIKYEYLQKNEFFCTPLQRKFYEHRVQLLETYIQNYINTTDEQNILKQLDSFEKQIDRAHNELNKTISEFKFLLKTIRKETKITK